MKNRVMAVFAAVMMVFVFAGSGFAASLKTDTQFMGKVTKVSGSKVTIQTIGEKSPQTYEINILDNALILQSDNGKILTDSAIKAGKVINVDVFHKGDDLYARMIWVEENEDYVIKAIMKDAKSGKYYKEIEP